MNNILMSPLFGICLSIGAFFIGTYINKKAKTPFANPIMIAIIIIIAFIKFFNIPSQCYSKGGDFISLFLAPATVVLAVNIYKSYSVLKQNIFPILAGTAVGSFASMGSIYLMCRAFSLDKVMIYSLLPKSVTTPIALEVATKLGGEGSITVACVILTGILGTILSPLLVKVMRLKNPVAIGLAIGTCSHAVGTTKAIEMGEVEGAMSGLAIGVAGLITVIFSIFI